uniref:RUN domain-containing protein n=2 Tax=Macrostomum lignano TaxID=282301 RepID=A0A1I8H7H8_9PLAT
MDPAGSVKSGLLAQLHSAVKACQRRFGGRRELASNNSEACVSNLLTAWENVLNHGLLQQPQQQHYPHHQQQQQQQQQHQQQQQGFQFALHNPQQLLPMLPASLSQLTSTISATFRGGQAPGAAQPTFWQALRELLSPDEAARFSAASDSDRARCRAWLRERINEASLERFVHTYLADPDLLARHYGPDAFVRDPDLCAALPNLAAGVNSILFAVSPPVASADFGGGCFSDDPSEDDCAIEVAAMAIDETAARLAVDPTSRSRRRQPPRPVVVSFDDDDAVSSAGSELSINRPDFPAAAAVSASAAAARSQPLQQPQASQQQQQAPAPPLPPASESGYNTSACSEAEASLASGSAP